TYCTSTRAICRRSTPSGPSPSTTRTDSWSRTRSTASPSATATSSRSTPMARSTCTYRQSRLVRTRNRTGCLCRRTRRSRQTCACALRGPRWPTAPGHPRHWSRRTETEQVLRRAEPGHFLESRDEGGQIVIAVAVGDGGRAELLGEARQRQRDAQALAFLEHEAQVLEEELELHLRLEAVLDHQRPAHIDHSGAAGAVLQDIEQPLRGEPALRAKHQGFSERGGIEGHQKVRGQLGQRRAAGRPDVDRPLSDGG